MPSRMHRTRKGTVPKSRPKPRNASSALAGLALNLRLHAINISNRRANESSFLGLPLNLPGSNETANDASLAKKPRESLRHLPPTLEVLARPGPLPAPLLFQASSNRERNGNVRTVARWAISRRTKSVPPDFFLAILLLFVPLLPLRGRGKLLPFLQPRGRGRRVLLMHSLPILMIISFFDSLKNADEVSIARLESFPKWTWPSIMFSPTYFSWLPYSPFLKARSFTSQLNHSSASPS
jgi:hypothetical protein